MYPPDSVDDSSSTLPMDKRDSSLSMSYTDESYTLPQFPPKSKAGIYEHAAVVLNSEEDFFLADSPPPAQVPGSPVESMDVSYHNISTLTDSAPTSFTTNMSLEASLEEERDRIHERMRRARGEQSNKQQDSAKDKKQKEKQEEEEEEEEVKEKEKKKKDKKAPEEIKDSMNSFSINPTPLFAFREPVLSQPDEDDRDSTTISRAASANSFLNGDSESMPVFSPVDLDLGSLEVMNDPSLFALAQEQARHKSRGKRLPTPPDTPSITPLPTLTPRSRFGEDDTPLALQYSCTQADISVDEEEQEAEKKGGKKSKKEAVKKGDKKTKKAEDGEVDGDEEDTHIGKGRKGKPTKKEQQKAKEKEQREKEEKTQREKAQREQEERERRALEEKEQREKEEKAQQKKIQQEKAQQEKAQQEKAQQEKAQREQEERERRALEEKEEQGREEKERLAKDKLEREKRAAADRERLEKAKTPAERARLQREIKMEHEMEKERKKREAEELHAKKLWATSLDVSDKDKKPTRKLFNKNKQEDWSSKLKEGKEKEQKEKVTQEKEAKTDRKDNDKKEKEKEKMAEKPIEKDIEATPEKSKSIQKVPKGTPLPPPTPPPAPPSTTTSPSPAIGGSFVDHVDGSLADGSLADTTFNFKLRDGTASQDEDASKTDAGSKRKTVKSAEAMAKQEAEAKKEKGKKVEKEETTKEKQPQKEKEEETVKTKVKEDKQKNKEEEEVVPDVLPSKTATTPVTKKYAKKSTLLAKAKKEETKEAEPTKKTEGKKAKVAETENENEGEEAPVHKKKEKKGAEEDEDEGGAEVSHGGDKTFKKVTIKDTKGKRVQMEKEEDSSFEEERGDEEEDELVVDKKRRLPFSMEKPSSSRRSPKKESVKTKKEVDFNGPEETSSWTKKRKTEEDKKGKAAAASPSKSLAPLREKANKKKQEAKKSKGKAKVVEEEEDDEEPGIRRSLRSAGKRKRFILESTQDDNDWITDEIEEEVQPKATKKKPKVEKPKEEDAEEKEETDGAPGSSTSPKKPAKPKNANKSLFRGISFGFTGISKNEALPDSEQKLKALIKSHGGTLVEASKFQSSSNHSPVSKKKTPKTVLISNEPHKTIKYIMAVAIGIPCVHFKWITASCEKGSLVPLDPHLLPAGSLIDSEFPVFIDSPHTDIFRGLRVEVVAYDSEFKEGWSKVLRSTGAKVVSRLFSEYEDRVECVLCNTQTGNDVVIERADKLGLPVVSVTWLIQCILQQKRVPYDGHPLYYTFNSVEYE